MVKGLLLVLLKAGSQLTLCHVSAIGGATIGVAMHHFAHRAVSAFREAVSLLSFMHADMPSNRTHKLKTIKTTKTTV